MMESQDNSRVLVETLMADAIENEDDEDNSEFFDCTDTPFLSNSTTATRICRHCACKATIFFCTECVVRGNFTRSDLPFGPRFADRHLKLIETNQRKLELADEFLSLSDPLYKVETLSRNIAREKWKIGRLKEHLQAARAENDKLKAQFVIGQRKIDEDNSRFSARVVNFSNAEKKLIEDRKKLEKFRSDAKLREISIIRLRKSLIKQLLRDIFPLVELDSQFAQIYNSENQSENCRTRQTEFCRILEPILPLDGNYTAYHNHASQALASPTDVNVRNPFYEIPAGLGMVAQLLHILIQILDFQMPDLVEFHKFLGSDLDENSFQQAVYQLNWNILTLCSSQGIAVEDLPLKETVGNLLKLTKCKQLGRTGPYDLSNVLVFNDEEPHTLTHNSFTDEDQQTLETLEAEDVDESDWENVPTASSSVLPAANPQDQQMTRSTFNSAVNAVSSLFRSTTEPEIRRTKL